MTPYELMLSESQERMLMVLKPEAEETARRIFEKWQLDFAVIGRITDTGALVVKEKGQNVVDIPVAPLVEASPEYDRPYDEIGAPTVVRAENVPAETSIPAALETLMASPDLCSRRWIWEQYDHMVMADTVFRPGGDAAVIRIMAPIKALPSLPTAPRAIARLTLRLGDARLSLKRGETSPL